VPPAFVLGTGLCRAYYASGRKLPGNLRELLVQGLARLEEATGGGFGRARRPLLGSVRSGAPISMPGMMDSIPNTGLDEASLRGLLRATGNPRLVQDCHRRLIRDFAQLWAALCQRQGRVPGIHRHAIHAGHPVESQLVVGDAIGRPGRRRKIGEFDRAILAAGDVGPGRRTDGET